MHDSARRLHGEKVARRRAIIDYVRHRVCAIGYVENGEPRIGTGNIIGNSVGSYVCTAKHVATGFLSSTDAQIAFFGGESVRRHEVVSCAHSHDRYDVSLLRLLKPRAHFYQFDSVVTNQRITNTDELAIYGVPSQWVQRRGSFQDVAGLLLFTNKYQGKNVINRANYQLHIHYPREKSDVLIIPGGGSLPKAPGFSGAFVMRFPKPSKNQIWTPETVHILGVQVEWYEHKLLVATRSWALIKLLEKQGLRRSI